MKRYRSDIFSFNTLKRTPEVGSLLVAEPFLRERYFLHAVVSLIDLERGGDPLGVVLNNCTALLLHEILDEVRAARQVPVFCGGPMSQDRLFFVHTLGDDIIPGAKAYAPGLWVGGDFKAAADYVNSGYPIDGFIRFFLGYSGWSYSQLLSELDNDVWAVTPGDTIPAQDLLSMHGDRLWHAVVRGMGSHYRNWKLHPASLQAN